MKKTITSRSSLSVTLFNDLNLMNLLEFHENSQDLAHGPNPKQQKHIFLEKKRRKVAQRWDFSKIFQFCFKKYDFSKKLEKVTDLDKVGSQECFYFLKIKQFHHLDSTNSFQDGRCTRTSLPSTQIAGSTVFFVFRFWTHKM